MKISRTRQFMYGLSTLTLCSLVCLLAACGNIVQPDGQAENTPTTATTPSSTAKVGSAPGASGTPGVNGPGCAGQATLASIRMLDTTHGWALNENAILKTTDGGKNWQCVTPTGWANKIGVEARASYLQDNLHAWVVPTPPAASNTVTVLRTSDGGQSWQSSTIAATVPGVGDPPHFINVQEGWLELVTNGGPGAGSESVDIFHTTDSGQSWSKIASTENPASGLPRGGLKSGISFRDAMHGWATGGDYSNTPWFYMTSDGGHSWQKQPLPDYPGYYGTAATQAQYQTTPPVFFGTTGLLPLQAVGQLDQGPQSAIHGFLLYTTHDGGQTWSSYWKTTPDTLTSFQTDPQGLYIVDPQHAWAVSRGDDGMMYGTTDGGQSWHQLAHVGRVTSMSFVDNQQGWLISEKSLQHTTDGGHSWQTITYNYPH